MNQQSMVQLKTPANLESGSVRLQRKCACEAIGETCSRCSSKRLRLQRKAGSLNFSENVPTVVNEVINSPGSSLDSTSMSFMAPRFGQDFSSVRIHTDSRAQESAGSVNAAAYTVGDNIVFGHGQFRPRDPLGKGLLAHELSHVIQQRQGVLNGSFLTDEVLEKEADSAANSVMEGKTVNISGATAPRLSRLTSEEAQRKLWRLVPSAVKPFARPIASQARAVIDTVVPPNTELPKPIETAVNKTMGIADTVKSSNTSTSPVTSSGAVKPVSQSQPPAKKKSSVTTWIKSQANEKLRDNVMESLGSLKGVMLEGTNIIDSVIWVSHAGSAVAEGTIEKAADFTGTSDESKNKALYVYRNFFSSYANLQELAKKHGWTDEVTGAVSISGKLGSGYDSLAEGFEKKAFEGTQTENAAMFTNYEFGELEGAIGTQVALAYVGVEEVQLVLKGLSVIGAVKSIVTSVQQNPKGWSSDPNFWVSILNAALTVIGIKQTKAAVKLSNILIAAGALGSAVPVILNLVKHYSDPQLAQNPAARQKVLAQDYSALLRIVADVVHSVIQHANATKKAGKPIHAGNDEPNEAGSRASPAAGSPAEDLPPPQSPSQIRKIPEMPSIPGKSNTTPAISSSAVPPSPTKPTLQPGASNHDPADSHSGGELTGQGKHLSASDTASAILKEDAIATKPVRLNNGEEHSAVVTKAGVGICSPNPCPVIHAEYKKELDQFPSFKAWNERIQALRKTNPKEAAEQASKLIKNLEAVRKNLVKTTQQITPAVKKIAMDSEIDQIVNVGIGEYTPGTPTSASAPSTLNTGSKSQQLRQNVRDAQTGGFQKGTQPGSVPLAVGDHSYSPSIRAELGVSGADFQSAHIAPTSFLESLPNYSRGKAKTVLLSSEIHTGLDAHWKNWAQQQRRDGKSQTSVSELHRVMGEAIDKAPGLSMETRNALHERLYQELYKDLGLQPSTPVLLPYANIPPSGL